ncbi:MAG: alpha/beta hydrolase [Xanthobacteraceae bacterium]|jgi:monoterpene epsilon-lactone hydrolase
MSVRAELLRLALRLLVKRGTRIAAGAEGWRRSTALAERLVPRPPRSFDLEAVTAGGVKAELVSWNGSARDILYLHGGGYVLGSPLLFRDLTWRLAKSARARVLCIDYRLAPEHPYPAALEDSIAAYRWLLGAAGSPNRIVVMGDSAGGGLALAMLLKLRDEGTPLPGAVVALSPWTDLTLTGASLRTNTEGGPTCKSEDFSIFAAWYLAGVDPSTPYASPLFGNLAGLPPVLIQVGSDEMLLDDSVRIAEKLRCAGGQVELEIWPRMPHGWHLYARIVPEGQRAITQIGEFVQANT